MAAKRLGDKTARFHFFDVFTWDCRRFRFQDPAWQEPDCRG